MTFFLNLIGVYHEFIKRIDRYESRDAFKYRVRVWGERNCIYFRAICEKARDAKFVDIILHSFEHKIFRKIMFPQLILIQDALEITCKYFAIAFGWIRNLFEAGKAKGRFQIDLCLSYANTHILPKSVIELDDADEDDSDDDDDNEIQPDLIGDIEDKLRHNNLKFQYDQISSINLHIAESKMMEMFDKHNEGNSIDGQRLITWIDRRDATYFDKALDDVYLYTPPKEYACLPDKEIPEVWFHMMSKQSLLPGRIKKEDITANINNEGQLLLLSFHVRSEQEVAIYLFYNGGMLRFEPVVC